MEMMNGNVFGNFTLAFKLSLSYILYGYKLITNLRLWYELLLTN